MSSVFFWKRSADPRTELHALVGDYELPTFSAGAIETLRLLREDAGLNLVAERLVADPGLSVRILRTVNSAAFGLRRQVTNLAQAVTLLGRGRVESLVLTAAVGEALPTPAGTIDVADFWRTSAHRACLARRLAARLHPAREMEAFTAGLLQDMAVPVLANSHPDRYAALYRRAESERVTSLHEIELDTLGYDHAQVGAMMAETWELPEPLITAIADHHLLGQRAPDAVEAVAYIRHGDPADELRALRDHCATHLDLGAETLDPMIEGAGAESASLADSMGAARG